MILNPPSNAIWHRSPHFCFFAPLEPHLGPPSEDLLETYADECPDVGEEDACPHVQDFANTESVRGRNAIERVCDSLIRLFAAAGHCPVLLRTGAALAKIIDSAMLTHWHSMIFKNDPIRDGPLPIKRHRRDDDLREALIARAPKKRSTTEHIGHVSLGVETKGLSTSRLPAYMISCWRCFQDQPGIVLSVALDAGDFGLPQEETMLYALWDGSRSAWGPPQAPALTCLRGVTDARSKFPWFLDSAVAVGSALKYIRCVFLCLFFYLGAENHLTTCPEIAGLWNTDVLEICLGRPGRH